jgi:membrane protease YdiL (CAAX protease family)
LLARLMVLILLVQCLGCASVRAEDSSAPPAPPKERMSAGAIGWGNLLVPGLGATLRDEPGVGLREAGLEIGSFYGGTILAPEKRFRIDGSIDLPESGNINNAVVAQTLQQFGLKYHFYNTFAHYQETALENADTAHEKNNPQPLYTGTASDTLKAPFEWQNLSSLWAWPVILFGATYLTIDYKTGSVPRQPLSLTPSGEALLGGSQVAAVPIGSYAGEDPLFRGFMQRELIGMTGSVPLAIVTQSALFSILHENHQNAFVVGVYLGISTMQNKGQLGPAMAVHFWLDLFDGLFTYLRERRAAGESAPLNPPISFSTMFEF